MGRGRLFHFTQLPLRHPNHSCTSFRIGTQLDHKFESHAIVRPPKEREIYILRAAEQPSVAVTTTHDYGHVHLGLGEHSADEM
jgi:hypothetical protein